MRKAVAIAALFVAGAGVLLVAQQSRDKMVDQTVAGTRFQTQPSFVIERMNPPGKSDTYLSDVRRRRASGRRQGVRRPPPAARQGRRRHLRIGAGDHRQAEHLPGAVVRRPYHVWKLSCAGDADEAGKLQAEVTSDSASQTPVRGSTVSWAAVEVCGVVAAVPGTARGGGTRVAAPGGRSASACRPARTDQRLLQGDRLQRRRRGRCRRACRALVGTVGDHGPHAIRRGPDGSMMIMSGNNSGTPLNQYLDPELAILGDKEARFLPMLRQAAAVAGGSQRDGVHSALFRFDPADPRAIPRSPAATATCTTSRTT